MFDSEGHLNIELRKKVKFFIFALFGHLNWSIESESFGLLSFRKKRMAPSMAKNDFYFNFFCFYLKFCNKTVFKNEQQFQPGFFKTKIRLGFVYIEQICIWPKIRLSQK